MSCDQLKEEKEHKLGSMTYFRRKWQVLMWKNLIVRKRHWFLTLFELVIPVLLFWLVAWMRQNDVIGKKANVVPKQINLRYSEATIIDYSFIHHDVVNLAYAPDTSFTRQIIQEFNRTLTSVLQNTSKLDSFDAFDSELKLEQFFHVKYENRSINTNHIGYGIVFEDIKDDATIPNDFKYKIRSTIPKWDTKLIFPQFLPAGPTDEADLYIYQGFLAIQMAIDNAYIQVASRGASVNDYTLAIQKFPFPAYKVDIFNELFKSLMPLFTSLSFITISISVLKKVVEEKASGVKEMMKMMGLQTWMVWAGWALNGLMVYAITCAVITTLLCYGYDSDKGPVIANVHFTIIFTLFILFCLAAIFFCFAISSFFMSPTIGMSVGMIVWVFSYTVLQASIGDTTLPLALHLLFSLVPMYNMCTGYNVIAAFESRGVAVNWLNLFSDAMGGSGTSLGSVMLMFFVQMAVYMIITWYVTSIHPGPYGRAEPWWFPCKFCMSSEEKKELMLGSDDEEDERYEAPPKDMKVGLKIQDLRKVFNGNMVAVDKVNLDIYEGQITALLGHNGAGKTTTMSILTGMYSPTAGSVYAKDYNIFQQMDRFRNSLGLCPQQDMLFPYLTALEHLIFFGMLKGMTMGLARSEGLKLLQMLNVSDKKTVLAEKLSGGMKRKLSLAIALIGSPQVLILDEPTSGMDPESRREMWDLLLSLRQNRTILITTHFMEEADVLGDRIAIMDHGKVKCYGTTLFLKRVYGTGYLLTVMKEVSSSVDSITHLIRGSVAGAELKTTHPTQVTYKVPQEQAPNLPDMFAAIEGNKEQLGISGVGISCTTMEEVFLRVGELAREEKYEFDKTSSHSKDQQHMIRNTSNEALTYKKRKGLPLFIQQFKSLILKRSLFNFRRPITSIIYFVLPAVLMWFMMKNNLMNVVQGSQDPPLTMHLSLYGHTSAYVSGPENLQFTYSQLVIQQDSSNMSVKGNIVEALLNIGVENVARYKTHVIVAANFEETNKTATALYNGLAYHSAPISVNMLTNALLRSNSRTSDNSITITNQPLDLENFAGACSQLNEVTLWITALVWLALLPIGVRTILTDIISYPHNERTSNAKQLQLMTGVAPTTYWLACFVWDYYIYLMACVLLLLLIPVLDTSNIFYEAKDYGVLLLILALHGVSGISNTYLYSFLGKSSNTAASIYMMITIVTGLMAPLVMYLLVTITYTVSDLVSPSLVKLIKYVLMLDPQFAFGSAILNFTYLLAVRSGCRQCDNDEFKKNMCKDTSYLEFSSKENTNGLMEYLLFLGFDWILYLGLILLIEYGYMGRAFHWLKVQWVGKDFDRLLTEDSDVRDERDRVDASRDPRSTDDSTVLTVDGLAKKFSRSFVAVQGVSFRVSAGECFGLLGVNGAGKTTTFRMLTGDENPTTGSARILQYDLVRDRSKYLAQIGYCPQFDGITEFLTGEEMLRLYANLRGIPESQIQHQIDEWISLLGLDEYRHRRCGKYSGGNKRKLSTAMALIGDPPVVFLDEPTTGVDPVARRNLWDVLARCQKSGQAIVLTSHSMEECEALCTRLTIMVKGRMMCIGSNQYLKQRYGQGYTIMIKLHTHPCKDVLLPQLKQEVQQSFMFRCKLKDEHTSLLHYHMTDTGMSLSNLFRIMERLKQVHPIIEDYTVSDTTLEQVFIMFARQSEQEA
ncbi:phospholipid-transporting ATPase ABCA1-like isoform X2 [Homalodisca vitripennis]|uniref:phospholipid-transporting ATPase ABCA1-like isoform X2 n=1 Tax=Homalodisca vitripennis TaxID=197043 RepID=UPI001EEC336B|nr:phospholipid-transporting ATPase ABCA1-like isoform X2 [Homalodisca vitripennis]